MSAGQGRSAGSRTPDPNPVAAIAEQAAASAGPPVPMSYQDADNLVHYLATMPGRRRNWLHAHPRAAVGIHLFEEAVESIVGGTLILLLYPFMHFAHVYVLMAVVMANGVMQSSWLHRVIGGPDGTRWVDTRVAVMIGIALSAIYLGGAAPLFNLATLTTVAIMRRWSGARVYRPAMLWVVVWTAFWQGAFSLGYVRTSWQHYDPVHMYVIVAMQTGVILASLRLMWQTQKDLESAQVQLTQSEEWHRELVQSAGDAVGVTGADGLYSYMSPAAIRVLGVPAEELIGTDGSLRLHPDDEPIVAAAIDGLGDDMEQEVRFEVRSLHGNGGYIWTEVTVRNLMDNPAVRGIVANYRDVTERRTLQERLRHLAFHDPLTGLTNRALFSERLAAAVAMERGPDDPTPAVAIVDLDDFKKINDTLGHDAGDALLVDVAAALSGVVRPEDTVARLGGDEFAVLFDGLDEAEAAAMGGRLIAALTVFEHGGETYPVRASVGIARCLDLGVPASELMRQADVALYRSKRSGKSRCTLFEPGMQLTDSVSAPLNADLGAAISAGQLDVHYQPIIMLATGQWLGVEALLRWRHNDVGWISPAEIVPLAQENGQLDALTGWVLERACDRLVQWRQHNPALTMSLNVTGDQMRNPEFLRQVRNTLDRHQLNPQSLMLELDTPLQLTDADLLDGLRAVRAEGIRVALDGPASAVGCLGSLGELPVNVVKIDRSIVGQVVTSPYAARLVESISGLCREKSIHVLVEGIESEAQRQAVLASGCATGQGAWFAPAGPPEDIERLLRAQSSAVRNTPAP